MFAAVVFTSCVRRPEPADMVLLNGKIVTVDDDKPQVEAVAIRGDIIVSTGNSSEIRLYVDQKTNVIDLKWKLAIPGFIEGHAHFLSLGYSLMRPDLSTARNWDEIVGIVAEAADEAQPGEWILAKGWHQEKWNEIPTPNVDGLPFHDALSKITPDNPVLLSHASGHSCIANEKAMEMAGITRETPDPEGGEIVRDSAGNPIGVFRETAMDSLYGAFNKSEEARTPEQIEAEKRRVIELAVRECLSHGITTFHDAGSLFETIDLYKELVTEGMLGIRLWVMIGEDNEELQKNLPRYKIVAMGDNRLTVSAIKRSIDGALGSHGAWLLAPYNDLPNSTGLNTETIEDLREAARLAIENDFQLCTHAIGDRGNREILNVYEETFETHQQKDELRWRIEHAQHLHPDDIPRFSRLDVIASMQGSHATSDGPWVIKRLGEKRAGEGAYVWQKLMESGALVANGTDAPVEDVNPLTSFYASVTRKLPDGTIFFPDQKMTRKEALRSYTINNAYAAFEEKIKGSITPGKLADITVLSGDIMTIPDEEILDTEVLYTIVGGKIMYQKDFNKE
jgi:predicted amidohydrolase YtcJ